MIVIILLSCTVAMSGGVVVGYLMGRFHQREFAARRHPPAPHEALARVYEMPAPAGILAELRGPLRGRP
jgi:membrane protein YqaA with SNARE-associated domain